jgi:hypothetical protein
MDRPSADLTALQVSVSAMHVRPRTARERGTNPPWRRRRLAFFAPRSSSASQALHLSPSSTFTPHLQASIKVDPDGYVDEFKTQVR